MECWNADLKAGYPCIHWLKGTRIIFCGIYISFKKIILINLDKSRLSPFIVWMLKVWTAAHLWVLLIVSQVFQKQKRCIFICFDGKINHVEDFKSNFSSSFQFSLKILHVFTIDCAIHFSHVKFCKTVRKAYFQKGVFSFHHYDWIRATIWNLEAQEDCWGTDVHRLVIFFQSSTSCPSLSLLKWPFVSHMNMLMFFVFCVLLVHLHSDLIVFWTLNFDVAIEAVR